MPKFSIKNVCLKGISAAVPKHTEENKNLNSYTKEELKKLIDTIGIEKRRIAKEHLSTSDLFLAAAKSLIDTLGWSRDDIEIIVCVTQTPDYVLPGTSSIIHHKLGLSKSCFVLDINQGCAGYIYGMSVISSLISSAKFKKGLLLVGDTITKNISKYDKS